MTKAVTTPVALVTGASSGIGVELARQLAAQGHDVALAARREAPMRELSRDLEAQCGVRTWVFPVDLAEPGAGRALHAQLTDAGLTVDYLVNNAGAVLEGRFLQSSTTQVAGNLQLLVGTPVELIHLCLPDMLAAGRGHVLTISSLGAFWPCFPGVSLYSGGKWMLVNLTRTLAAEYAGSGVRFSVTVPFTTRTPFLDTPANQAIIGTVPEIMVQSAEDVARIALTGAARGRVLQHTSMINRVIAKLLRMAPPGPLARAITVLTLDRREAPDHSPAH
jgi:short-subunit dehydrogenase